MTNEITRENVQSRLDHRAAEFKKREAVLERQAQLLRLIINDNHSTKTAPKSPERPQDKAKTEEVPQVKAEVVPLSRREQEAAECRAWYKFMSLVFGPLLIAGMLVSLAGTAPIAIPLLILMAAYTGIILLTAIKAFFPKHSLRYIKTVATRLLFAERS